MSGRVPPHALVGALLLALPGAAAAAPPHPCSTIDDPSRRLACFDAAFPREAPAGKPDVAAAVERGTGVGAAAATAGTSATAATAATATAAPAAAEAAKPAASAGATKAETFGLPTPPVRPEKPTEPEQIAGRIVAVGQTPSGKLVVTLENGGVWLQTDTASRAGLKAGVDVRIEKAMLGSYLLLTPDKRAIRVRRVQ